jgi:hypothetical protein
MIQLLQPLPLSLVLKLETDEKVHADVRGTLLLLLLLLPLLLLLLGVVLARCCQRL